jgi:acetyltransferase
VSIRNLEFAFRPRSIALIGASDRPASVGAKLLENLTAAGFPGPVMAVNPTRDRIGEMPVYPSVAALPSVPDLAVVATPAVTVPDIIDELGRRGTKAVVVISAGFAETGTAGSTLQQGMLDAARPHLVRIIGPNCVGILVPRTHVNASFAHLSPQPGNIAFATQSGAVLTAVMDWAEGRGIGFSHLLSLGGMADVDFGDVLDYLANDDDTHAILLYIEAITHTRKFMSAARAAARTKPVVVCKSGRHAESARAAHSHSGALAGADAVYDAAFRRAGALRVFALEDLFDAVQMLAIGRQPRGERLAIITNGGGMGILATDQLLDEGGHLAELSAGTIEQLNATLPAAWSHGNPIDIVGDATGERYGRVIDVVMADPNVDAALVMNCPVALASGIDSARVLLDAYRRITTKPIIASWVGGDYQQESRQLFATNQLPSYDTPEDAIRAFMYLVNYQRGQRALMQTPHSLPVALSPDRGQARTIIAQALARGPGWLRPDEARAVLTAYEVPVIEVRICDSADAAAQAAAAIGGPVALKVNSPDISHKTDLGGVVLDLANPAAVRAAADAMLQRIAKTHPDAHLEGFTVEPMVRSRDGYELLVGAYEDAQFGPVVVFGHGGTAVEVRADTALGLPPLNLTLTQELMSRTRVFRLLQGYRGQPGVDLPQVALTLMRVAQLVIDLPEVVELDINPLIADRERVIALDVRIRLAPATAPGTDRLAICPYPSELEETITLNDGTALLLRPIRPEDEPSLHAAFAKLTPEEIHLRFFVAMRHLPPLMAARFTQIDYDREMALIVTQPGIAGTTEIFAVVRMLEDPDRERAEFAIIVRHEFANRGLGTLLMQRLIRYARARGVGLLVGDVLSENRRMLTLCRELGFAIDFHPDDPSYVTVSFDLRAHG